MMLDATPEDYFQLSFSLCQVILSLLDDKTFGAILGYDVVLALVFISALVFKIKRKLLIPVNLLILAVAEFAFAGLFIVKEASSTADKKLDGGSAFLIWARLASGLLFTYSYSVYKNNDEEDDDDLTEEQNVKFKADDGTITTKELGTAPPINEVNPEPT